MEVGLGLARGWIVRSRHERKPVVLEVPLVNQVPEFFYIGVGWLTEGCVLNA